MRSLPLRFGMAPLLSMMLFLGACSAPPVPPSAGLTPKQVLSLMDALLWEVPPTALARDATWRLRVLHFEAGRLVTDQPHFLSWKAGEFSAAGFLLRERKDSGVPRVFVTSYRFGPGNSSTTVDTVGFPADTSLRHANETPSWDPGAAPSQTVAAYGLYRSSVNSDGVVRQESIDWNEETRNSAEFQALPSVVVVLLENP